MGQDIIGHDRMGQDIMGHDRMGHDIMGHDRMVHDRRGWMGQRRTKLYKTIQDRVGQDRT